MKFGYFSKIYNLDHEPFGPILERAVDEALLVEQGGFHTYWTGEHHFGGEGWDVDPNPLMLLADLANRTSRIRLGSAAIILPQWDPLRAAEDVALLDWLSDGRVDCGVGRGINSRELANLGPHHATRRDDARNQRLFLECVDIIRRAWTEDAFTYNGEFFRYPLPGVQDPAASWYPRDERWRSETGEYVAMSVQPKPKQQPHPPLYNMVDNPAGFAHCAELGIKPITLLRSRQALKAVFEAYQREATIVNGREMRLGEDCGLQRACFVAPTYEEARRLAEPGIEYFFGRYLAGIRSRQIFAEPGETLSAAELDKTWFDFLYDRGHLFVGSPAQVIELIEQFQEEVGLESLLTYFAFPNMAHSDLMGAIDLFCEEVVPHFADQADRSEQTLQTEVQR